MTEASDAYYKMIEEWQQAKKNMDGWATIELDLRLRLANGAIPNPTEGANTFTMADGRRVCVQHKINRKVDEAALPGVLQAMREKGHNNPEDVIRYKPELAMTEFRNLNQEMSLIFSEAVISSVGTPQLEIKAPATRRGKTK